MNKSDLVSIVLPVYNEVEIVSDVIKKIQQTMKKNKIRVEILTVDDGSTDGTTELLKKMKGIRHIHHPLNIGNGAAVKTGIRNAKGKYVVLMDSDGQHDPNDIPEMLSYFPDYDMVVGARSKKSKKLSSPERNFANWVYATLASYLSETKIPDLTSGFRAMKRDHVKGFLYILPNTFSYPTTITLAMLRLGYAVKFIPIIANKRVGKSKIKLVKDGARFFMIIFRIIGLFNPLKVFLPTSIVVFVLGVVHVLLRLYYEPWANTGRPINHTSVTIFMTAIFIFLMGLISEQISQSRFDRVD